MSKKTKFLVHGGVLAALYVVLTYAQNLLWPGSTTMAIQMRLSEALCIFAFYLISGLAALLLLVRKYPNMFMFIRSTTLSTERIKYRVAFSSVTMVFALILLSAIIVQNMIA